MSLSAPAPVNTPENRTIIENDGFFPNINLLEMREVVRLDGTVTDARLTHAVTVAMISVNEELAAWKSTQQASFATLADIGPKINKVGVKMTCYLSAIYRNARADIAEQYRNADTTKAGEKNAEKLDETIADDRRQARWSISFILDKPKSTIELI